MHNNLSDENLIWFEALCLRLRERNEKEREEKKKTDQ